MDLQQKETSNDSLASDSKSSSLNSKLGQESVSLLLVCTYFNQYFITAAK